MKTIAILIALITLAIAAGCVTPSEPATTPPAPAALPGSVDSLTSQGAALPMGTHVPFTTRNTTFEVWIDSFEVGDVQETGDQELTIWVAAKNTGTGPLRMTWFSKLTDANGKTYGGIGISKGGSGARSGWIPFNMTELARDYVVVRSDRDLAALNEGAVLDVYFMEKPDDETPISDIPDYHVRWTIDPGTIR